MPSAPVDQQAGDAAGGRVAGPGGGNESRWETVHGEMAQIDCRRASATAPGLVTQSEPAQISRLPGAQIRWHRTAKAPAEGRRTGARLRPGPGRAAARGASPCRDLAAGSVRGRMRQLDGHAHETLRMELETRLVVRESTGPRQSLAKDL
jgi:hypothetical protein